jgi:hypothetical protein
MLFNASLRMEAKSQRVERWSTDFHSSYERSCCSKFLCVDVSITTLMDNGPESLPRI